MDYGNGNDGGKTNSNGEARGTPTFCNLLKNSSPVEVSTWGLFHPNEAAHVALYPIGTHLGHSDTKNWYENLNNLAMSDAAVSLRT